MKRRMRPLLTILVLIAAMATLPPSALAEEVRITVTADPTELTEAGNVSLSFSISNFSDYQLHDITISSGGVVYDLGEQAIQIPMGGSAYDIRIALFIPDSQIGLERIFTVSWIQGGEPRSQDVPVTIRRAADPIISLTRTANTPMARQGDVITLDYVLTNDTVFDMTDITLIDEQVSDNAISRYTDVLRAGTSITLQYLYTMGDGDVVSAPVVTYTVNGKLKTFSAIEPLTLRMMLVKVSASVSQSTPTAAGVTFTIQLRNDGNQDLAGLQITDDRGMPLLNPTVSLPAGDTLTTEYTVIPDVNEPVRNVSFSVTAKDPYGGDYTLQPEKMYEVYPFVDDAQIQTSLRAEIIEPWSAASASIKVRIVLVNYSEVPISNVQISETMLGLIAQIPSLQSGENTLEQIIPLGAPRNLAFAAKGVDPTGTMRELCAVTLPVAYEGTTDAAPTPKPTLKPDDGALERTIGSITGTLSKILIVLGVIMTVAFIGMVVLSIMERSRVLQLKQDLLEQERSRPVKKKRPGRPPERESLPQAKTIWIERDRAMPLAGAAPARPAASKLYRPVEVEYDDEALADDGYEDDLLSVADGDGFDGDAVITYVRTPHAAPAQDYIDVEYERVDAPGPAPAAGPKTIRIKAEPAVQQRKRPSVKRVGGTEAQDDGGGKDE